MAFLPAVAVSQLYVAVVAELLAGKPGLRSSFDAGLDRGGVFWRLELENEVLEVGEEDFVEERAFEGEMKERSLVY